MVSKRSFFRRYKAISLIVITSILGVFVIKTSNLGFDSPFIINKPISVIKGKKSKLNRPEGIDFAPSGDYFAVANAEANRISFYKRKRVHDIAFETTPFFTIQGPTSLLNYPHDLSFSPDGCHLAVANRHGNLITVYKKNPNNSCFNPSPITIIKGETSKLVSPNAIKYAPIGNSLAVANLKGNTITFYRYQEDQYEQAPYQVLQNSIDILNIPDGLAFSGNGELLAVTSHGNNSVVFYQRIPNSSSMYFSDPVEILQGNETNFCFTHSLCFHPKTDNLVVSNAGGKKNLMVFKKNSETFPRYTTIPEQILEIYSPKTIHLQDKYPEEGGVKGIAFSPDGIYLGLCASDIENPRQSILIFPVNHLSK